MVTDEMVRAATKAHCIEAAAIMGEPPPPDCDGGCPGCREDVHGPVRAALEAVAPMIRKAVLKEFVKHIPTTSARPGDSSWAIGFYECQSRVICAIRDLGEA